MDLELSVEEEIQDVSMGRPHVVILGAGCSLAAFPNGDRHRRRLPLMNNLIQLLGLGDSLRSAGVIDYSGNFEELYGQLASDDRYLALRTDIEKTVEDYFKKMALPADPTIYDRLLLSLRSKDCIATFNWDPFLWDAWDRVQRLSPALRPPKTFFLHGNVRIGICYEHKRFGPVSRECPACARDFVAARLLFPVRNKDYATDPFVQDQWNGLRKYLRNAYMLTIFGYGAPKSDREAVSLMKDAWGAPAIKNLEQIEMIDVKSKAQLAETWSDFIHTHHYQTSSNFEDSWIATHPRRTCEMMWKQLMECRFVNKNSMPRDAGWTELKTWVEPLLDAEMATIEKPDGEGEQVKTR